MPYSSGGGELGNCSAPPCHAFHTQPSYRDREIYCALNKQRRQKRTILSEGVDYTAIFILFLGVYLPQIQEKLRNKIIKFRAVNYALLDPKVKKSGSNCPTIREIDTNTIHTD